MQIFRVLRVISFLFFFFCFTYEKWTTRYLLLCTSLQIGFPFEKHECRAIFTFTMNIQAFIFRIFGEKITTRDIFQRFPRF